MRATLTDAIDGVWALRVIRGVVLPGVLGLMGWAVVELVAMRDGVRDLNAVARELRAQVMDIRADAAAAMKDAETFRREAIKSDADTKARLNALEEAVKSLREQVAQIWRRSQVDGGAVPG